MGRHRSTGSIRETAEISPSKVESAPARPPAGTGRPNTRASRAWVPTAAAVLCAVIGAVDVADALVHGFFTKVRWVTTYLPGALTHAAVAATTVTGILLLLLSRALRRRKRRAWLAVVTLLAASIGLHIVKAFDVEEAVVALVMLVALVVYRDEFYAVGDPRTRWRALGAFLGLLVLGIGLGLLLLELNAESIASAHPFPDLLREVLYGLVGVAGPLHFTNDRATDLTAQVLFALGLLTAVTTAYLLLRPAEPQAKLEPADETRMRELLA